MMWHNNLKSTAISLYTLSFFSTVTYVALVHYRPKCSPQNTLISHVASRASSDDFVILAVVDSSVVDMAFNFYESSLKAHGIKNFLFLGLDPDACAILSTAQISCFHYNDVNTSDASTSVFNSKDFLRKMAARNAIIMETLTAGFNIILTDLDMVFLKNPLSDIKATMQYVDVAAMMDFKQYNAGFVVMKSTANSLKLWETTCNMTSIDKKVNDQQAFNAAVKLLKRNGNFRLRILEGVGNTTEVSENYKPLEIEQLDKYQYACGGEYFDNSQRWFPTEPLGCYDKNATRCADVVHNNWIVTHEAKVYRFKEHMMWLYDKAGYYSAKSTRYLVYDNPARVKWPHKGNSSSLQQLDALTTALAIGRILDRVVILPRFHCSNKTRLFECPLNSLISIARFDAQFNGSYRESSFLRHPKVPIKVREGVTMSHNFTCSNESTSLSKRLTVTVEQLRKMLGSVSGSVVSLGCLYDVRVTFDSSDEQKAFDSTVKKAIVTSGYRQYNMMHG